MDNEKKWLLITYYCPTHGDSDTLKSIELKKKEMREKIPKKTKAS